MPENIRALIVILALAAPAFYIGRQIASSVIADREFVVWRNVWFAVTVVAFLSVNLFIHAMMLAAACLYARSVRATSLGLFIILLFAAPLGHFSIGGAGIVNQLIDVNNARLLAIFLLLPILFKTRGFDRRQVGVYAMPDWLVVGYVLLSTALRFRGADVTVTGVMRGGTGYALDVLIPYFAFSRTATTMADVRKVFLAFVIAVLPLSLIAAFEMAKHWHLYGSLAANWDFNIGAYYLVREGSLRATVMTVSPIVIGYIIMAAIGCMLGLWRTVGSSRMRVLVLIFFAVGLLATLSRGPWVGAAVLLLVYFAIGPNKIANLGKFAVIGAVGLALLLIMPGGTRLINLLPFIGSVDEAGLSYRQNLFANSIAVIQRNPLFGTEDYRETPEMIEMTQGEGIIDIVNTYLEIAMRQGLLGLSLFVGVFVTILLGLRRVLKFHAVSDANFKGYVRASIATLIGVLVTIASVSSIDFIPYVYWSFAGLCVALIRVGYKERSGTAHAVSANRAGVYKRTPANRA